MKYQSMVEYAPDKFNLSVGSQKLRSGLEILSNSEDGQIYWNSRPMGPCHPTGMKEFRSARDVAQILSKMVGFQVGKDVPVNDVYKDNKGLAKMIFQDYIVARRNGHDLVAVTSSEPEQEFSL